MRLLTVVFLALLSTAISGQQYQVDGEQTKVEFKIKNLGLSVDGTFAGTSGKIEFSENEASDNRVEVSVDASTIDTGIGLRNKHLKDEDYFHVEKFTTLQFVSSRIAIVKPGQGEATGSLTIKGTTKRITFPFTYSTQGSDATFNATFKVNRRDFGVGGRSFSLSDEATVTVSIKAKKTG